MVRPWGDRCAHSLPTSEGPWAQVSACTFKDALTHPSHPQK